MPYGTTKRTYTKKYGASRRTSTTRRQSAARKATINRARYKKPTVRTNRSVALSNARLANRNALAIKRLKFNEWGSIQSQVSANLDGHTFSADHPLCFHVNNLFCGSHGPHFWRPNAYGSPEPVVNLGGLGGSAEFKLYQGEGNDAGDMDDQDIKHIPNGPKLKLLWATYEFEFEGYLDATHVRVDFVRQKKMDVDWYHTSKGQENYLPHSLCAFKQLAGFTQNRIDRTKFQILASKRVYFNSKGSAKSSVELTALKLSGALHEFN